MQEQRWNPELRRWLDQSRPRGRLRVVGIAEVRAPDSPSRRAGCGALSSWIDSGHAGEMEYLKRRDEPGTLLRGNLRVAMPWARSVIVCAMNYNFAAPSG